MKVYDQLMTKYSSFRVTCSLSIQETRCVPTISVRRTRGLNVVVSSVAQIRMLRKKSAASAKPFVPSAVVGQRPGVSIEREQFLIRHIRIAPRHDTDLTAAS